MRPLPIASLAFALLIPLAAGCAPAVEDEPGGDAEQADMDQLRSLPYVAFSAVARESDQRGVIHHDVDRSWPGYNLYINQFLCSAELIDAKGRLVNAWRHAPCHHWENGRLLDNGDLVVTGMGVLTEDRFRELHVQKRYLLRMTWEGETIWKAPIPAHHDVAEMPEGNLLTLSMSYRNEPGFHRGLEVRDNLLTLVSPDGEVIEEASLWEIFTDPEAGFTVEKSGLKIKHKKRRMREFDVFHANSVERIDRPNLVGRHPIYSPDNVIITSRNQDVVAIIDWSRKKLIWSWGREEISGPHDATVLENGNILVFDNGLGRKWSRGLELDPMSGEIVWEYRAPDPEAFYTRSRGGIQRLPNGNTLMTNSNSGQALEVTPEGDVVWDFYTFHSDREGHLATMFRMERYPLELVERIRAARGAGSPGAG